MPAGEVVAIVVTDEMREEYEAYKKLYASHEDPPICVNCPLGVWAFCMDTGWMCQRFTRLLRRPEPKEKKPNAKSKKPNDSDRKAEANPNRKRR